MSEYPDTYFVLGFTAPFGITLTGADFLICFSERILLQFSKIINKIYQIIDYFVTEVYNFNV